MPTISSRPPPVSMRTERAARLHHPSPALSACVRACMVRNTYGHALRHTQRFNYFPASPLCSLTWVMQGEMQGVQLDSKLPPGTDATLQPSPGGWVLGGPQTKPMASWNPGPVHTLTVLFMPDALFALTGLQPGALLDHLVDAREALPAEWLALHQAILNAPDDPHRLQALEQFLTPRWHAARPAGARLGHRHMDWISHLSARAAASGTGRSLRQLERRIKQWAGQTQRDLLLLGRSEQAFFDVASAYLHGELNWAQQALKAGFSDQAHFCRIARRITGFSPEALLNGMLHDEAFWFYRLWL